MNILIPGIIVLFTLLNISSYFVGLIGSPKYTVFTGAVHYPLDYLYYLSFITQGKHHWLMGANLSSGETTKLEFVNWVYILGGHIGAWFRLDAPTIYQVLVVIASVIYLIVAYKLIHLLIPKNTPARLLLYVLFLTSNAFPKIYQEAGRWVFAYFHPFNNFGHPFIRLTNVPHQVFIQAAIMGGLFATIAFWQQKKGRLLAVASVIGFLLGSMQPLQWAFVSFVLGASGIFAWSKMYRGEKVHKWTVEVVYTFGPAIIFFLGGITPALYLKQLYTREPYAFTLMWENWQQIHIPFWDFIVLNGPLMIVALIGLPWALRKLTIPTFPVIFYGILATGIFFSPIPSMLKILNIRFLSAVPTLAIAYVATSTFWSLARIYWPSRQKVASWTMAFLTIAITIPVTISQLYERTNFPPENVSLYLPLGAFQAFREAEKVVKPTETVLVDPLFAPQFAGLVGRHVFVSNMFATVDYERKNKEAGRFLYERVSSEEKMAWLAANNISYILSYAWSPIDLPNLTLLYGNLYAVLYKVNKTP